ncbi:MAG: hypothetical protein Q7R99_04055 [bacterium]|nr:hypothetical protein [bacterium]
MIKIWKIILIAITIIGFVGFLAVGYWYKTEGPAMAIDYNSGTEVVCEEPIPVGVALDTTINFLDKIYQRYQGNAIQTASKQVDDLVGAIVGDNGKVCDFNGECKAQVGTGGPDLTIGAQLLPGMATLGYTYTVPGCKLKEATGNPCPDLSPYVQNAGQSLASWLNQEKANTLSLDEMANSLKAQADNVHDLFGGETALVPYGLEESGEPAGETMISEADLVKRYVKYVDTNWFTPNPQRNNCALSELDRKRIEQGTMGDKYPLQCLEALKKDMYVPKPWSEMCQKECETFSQKCRDCLANCEGDSVYAALNCKIYSLGNGKAMNTRCYLCLSENDCTGNKKCGEGCTWGDRIIVDGNPAPECYTTPQAAIGEDPKCAFVPGQSKNCCGSVCADGFNTVCKECLCKGLDQNQCLDWICGGSRSNWVCCHEQPIQNPQWYTSDQVFATIDVIDPTTRLIITSDTKFGKTFGIFNDVWNTPGANLDKDFMALVMANSYRESKFASSIGGCNVVNSTTLKHIKKGTIYNENAFGDGQYSALVKVINNLNSINIIIDGESYGYNYDLNKVPVSCPAPRVSMAGGAIGPAQFIPTTWLKYGPQVETIKGGTYKANPWSQYDAYFAEALFLKKLKEDGDHNGGPHTEGEAVAHYMGYKSLGTKAAQDLANETLCIKRIFQTQIDNHCFEEENKTNRNSFCKLDLTTYIRNNCITTKTALRTLLEKLVFWK